MSKKLTRPTLREEIRELVIKPVFGAIERDEITSMILKAVRRRVPREPEPSYCNCRKAMLRELR